MTQGTNTFHLGPVAVQVVPKGQELKTLGHQIVRTRFTDTGLYHGRLIEKVFEQEKVMRDVAPTQSRTLGGQKLFHMDRWNYPEMDLLNARVEALFRYVTKSPTAHIDHNWINIYREHDYIGPHAHRRATMSAVYALAEGTRNDDDPVSGSFCFVDPRLDNCCMERRQYMTTPWVIPLPAGTMIMFPAILTHMVTPYLGTEPRITIAWNLVPEPVAGTPFDSRINDGDPAATGPAA